MLLPRIRSILVVQKCPWKSSYPHNQSFPPLLLRLLTGRRRDTQTGSVMLCKHCNDNNKEWHNEKKRKSTHTHTHYVLRVESHQWMIKEKSVFLFDRQYYYLVLYIRPLDRIRMGASIPIRIVVHASLLLAYHTLRPYNATTNKTTFVSLTTAQQQPQHIIILL